jgi:hypothetical protein
VYVCVCTHVCMYVCVCVCNEAKETLKGLFQEVLGRAPDLEGLTAHAR